MKRVDKAEKRSKLPKSTGKSAYRVEILGTVAVLHLLSSHYHADVMEPLSDVLKTADASSASGVVVVNLDGVLLLSSTALRALRAAHIKLEARRGRIVAAGGGELVVGVLKFAPFIEHYPNLEAAVDATGSAPDAS